VQTYDGQKSQQDDTLLVKMQYIDMAEIISFSADSDPNPASHELICLRLFTDVFQEINSSVSPFLKKDDGVVMLLSMGRLHARGPIF
jgi:hypothetical protein